MSTASKAAVRTSARVSNRNGAVTLRVGDQKVTAPYAGIALLPDPDSQYGSLYFAVSEYWAPMFHSGVVYHMMIVSP